MDNFKKIVDLISHSDVQFNDQTELLSLFSSASDAELEPAVKLFESDSAWIGRINENYKKKKKAFLEKDENLWQSIVEEEKKLLEEIVKYNSTL